MWVSSLVAERMRVAGSAQLPFGLVAGMYNVEVLLGVVNEAKNGQFEIFQITAIYSLSHSSAKFLNSRESTIGTFLAF